MVRTIVSVTLPPLFQFLVPETSGFNEVIPDFIRGAFVVVTASKRGMGGSMPWFLPECKPCLRLKYFPCSGFIKSFNGTFGLEEKFFGVVAAGFGGVEEGGWDSFIHFLLDMFDGVREGGDDLIFFGGFEVDLYLKFSDWEVWQFVFVAVWIDYCGKS